MTSLLIAAHGTRLPAGQQASRELVEKVRALLPDVAVSDAYVELDVPTIPDAVADALAADPERHLVVVPLMLGTGGHVQDDIPEAIAEGRARSGGVVTCTPHLGPDSRLRAAVRDRIRQAEPAWLPEETTVVLLGRGTSLTQTNADHLRLARLIHEEGGYADVLAGFIQVAKPSLPTALDRAYALDARRVVVMPHFMFPGRLRDWADEQAAAWSEAHPDAEVRLADVLGPCDELAEVVADRFRQAAAGSRSPDESPVYLSGLVLRGRRVVVVGAGRVASRRIDALLAAGAAVTVVAPEVSDKIEQLAASGALQLHRRAFGPDEVADAWYVLALTNDPGVNAQVAKLCEESRTFCVRADDASGGTAWTPATGSAAGVTLGVVGRGDPHLAARARSTAVEALREAFG